MPFYACIHVDGRKKFQVLCHGILNNLLLSKLLLCYQLYICISSMTRSPTCLAMLWLLFFCRNMQRKEKKWYISCEVGCDWVRCEGDTFVAWRKVFLSWNHLGNTPNNWSHNYIHKVFPKLSSIPSSNYHSSAQTTRVRFPVWAQRKEIYFLAAFQSLKDHQQKGTIIRKNTKKNK